MDCLSRRVHVNASVLSQNVIAHYSLGNLYYGPLKNEQLSAYHYQMTLNIGPTLSMQLRLESGC